MHSLSKVMILMARIIVYSDFLKSNKNKSQIMNTIDYNGQREGVQLNDPDNLDMFRNLLIKSMKNIQ